MHVSTLPPGGVAFTLPGLLIVPAGDQLGCRPGALLLDEPTNHLDDQAVEFVEDHLRELPGVVAASRAGLLTQPIGCHTMAIVRLLLVGGCYGFS